MYLFDLTFQIELVWKIIRCTGIPNNCLTFHHFKLKIIVYTKEKDTISKIMFAMFNTFIAASHDIV